jgi:hypothetical protein
MKSVGKVQEALIAHGAVGIQTMYDADNGGQTLYDQVQKNPGFLLGDGSDHS